jgi:hypothetical protein
MKRLFLWLGVGTLIWLGCEKQTGTGTTVIDSPDLQLAAVDAGCTDVLLKITAGHQRYSGPLLLLQNDEPVDTLNYGGADTLMWRQNLAINAAYHWRIRWQDDRDKYAETQATTLDTTRYDFSWETFEFGFGRSSSHLADVAIINENNIWAVGEIYTEDTYTYDSLGNWIQPYNAVHWDGNTWELKRIPFQTFCGQPGTSIYPISTLIAFSKNNIYFTSSSRLTHWNGDTFKVLDCIPVSVNKFWGLSPDDFFAVGAIGKIAHYDGSEWQRIESPEGTDLEFTDISGYDNHLFTCGAKTDVGAGIFRMNGTNDLTLLYWIDYDDWILPFPDRISGRIVNLWQGSPYWVWSATYNGLYRFCSEDINLLYSYPGLPLLWLGYKQLIRGRANNDILIVGSDVVWHYNGHRLKNINLPQNPGSIIYGLDAKDNIAVCVGQSVDSPNAVLFKLTKY